MEDYIVIGALIWLAAAAYLVWRVRRCIQRQISEVPELTWLIYLVVFTLFAPVIAVAGRWDRRAGVAALLAAFAVSFALSYKAITRYRKWLEEQKRKREDEER